MLTRILRVTGIEFYKLRHRAAPYVLAALLLLIVIGQGASTANEERARPDRTRELNAYVVFADAANTGLLLAALLLVLYASVAFSGEFGLGTMKALLTRPVTRLEFLLGKVLALLLLALGLGAGVLAAAAASGGALSRYEGVRNVAHNLRDTRLPVDPLPPSPDGGAPGAAEWARLNLAAHWDPAAAVGADEPGGALRVDRVREGSFAADQAGILPGDIVTHVAAGDAPPARLRSFADWSAWMARLQDGDTVLLRLDHPVEAPETYFTADYLRGQTLRALAMAPLALVAAACFGLAWSIVSEGVGLSVGGALLSFLAIRFPLSVLVVSALWIGAGTRVFAEDVERALFTTYLWLPMARLRGGATGTTNMEITARHVRASLLVCGVTALVCLAVALWRFRRKDVL